MTSLVDINGVKGLRPGLPISASLQIGIKKGFSPSGIPDQKDRFHLVTDREVDGVKRHHPAFALFNNAPREYRQMVRGVIVHATAQECFGHSLAMQTFPKGHDGPRSNPMKMPVCKGDGQHALRWFPKDLDDYGHESYKDIECPGLICPYNQDGDCKVQCRFIFSIRWAQDSRFEKLSSPLVKFSSRGRETTSNILGLFDYVDRATESLGINNPTLFGLPFTMTLTFRTNKARKSRYPVVKISPDMDIFEFLLSQRHKIDQISDAARRPVAITDQSLQDPDVVYEDLGSISRMEPNE